MDTLTSYRTEHLALATAQEKLAVVNNQLTDSVYVSSNCTLTRNSVPANFTYGVSILLGMIGANNVLGYPVDELNAKIQDCATLANAIEEHKSLVKEINLRIDLLQTIYANLSKRSRIKLAKEKLDEFITDKS